MPYYIYTVYNLTSDLGKNFDRYCSNSHELVLKIGIYVRIYNNGNNNRQQWLPREHSDQLKSSTATLILNLRCTVPRIKRNFWLAIWSHFLVFRSKRIFRCSFIQLVKIEIEVSFKKSPFGRKCKFGHLWRKRCEIMNCLERMSRCGPCKNNKHHLDFRIINTIETHTTKITFRMTLDQGNFRPRLK